MKEALILSRAPRGPVGWSWRLSGSGFDVVEGRDNSFDLVDEAGEVVLSIPPALVEDSSGQSGIAEPAQTNASMDVRRDGDDWVLTVTPDESWLGDPARVYPVSVDPTVNLPDENVYSYKSDGVVVHNSGAKVGNSRSSGKDTHWRAVLHYNYEQFFGKQILDANLYGVVQLGTTNHAVGTVRWASAFNYNGTGPHLSYFTVGADGWATDDGLASRVAQWVRESNTGAYIMLTGAEIPGAYTYKSMDTVLQVTWVDFPNAGSRTAPSPENGARSSLTPTLAVSSSDPSGTGLDWRFVVGTTSNPDASSVWNSGWINAGSVPVPPSVLAQGTTYYWKAYVRNGYDGLWGTSTVRGSATWSFVTNQLPTVGQGTASPPSPSTVVTLTPTLSGSAVTDPNGDALSYLVRIASGSDASTGVVLTSGWISSPSFAVPAGSLRDGGTYTWTILTKDAYDTSPVPWVGRFTVNQRLAESGPAPVHGVGDVSVNLANGNAGLRFESPSVSTLGGPMGMTFSYNSRTSTPRGLLAQYYDATPPPGQSPVYDFAGREPVLTRIDPQISFDWGTGSPGPAVPVNHFMSRWTGFITVPSGSGGSWRFGVVQDDGARIHVDGTQVLDRWTNQAPGPVHWGSPITLSDTQAYPIRVEAFEGAVTAGVTLWARTPSGQELIVPSSWLSPTQVVLPSGWTASTPLAGDYGAYVSATVDAGAVVLTDATGTAHTYARTSAGGYTPPPGQHGVLALDGQGLVTLTEEDGTVYAFGANGRLASTTPPIDTVSPATPTTTYRPGSGLLDAVTDPVTGRAVRFFYAGDTAPSGLSTNNGTQACLLPGPGLAPAPAGMICRIVYPGATAGTFGASTTVGYDADGRLVRIIDPGNEISDLAYDSEGRLTQIRSALANDWLLSDTAHPDTEASRTVLTYDGSGRVASVTLPAPDGEPTTARPTETFTYGSGTTHVQRTGISGNARTVTYDSALRQLADTTATGLTSTQTWSANDLVQSSTDPAGRKSTTIYDDQDRAWQTFGSAPAACFDAAGFPVSGIPTPDCPTVPAHTTTSYDGGMHGLAASYYPNTTLSGPPKTFTLGIGGTNGDMSANWGSASPTAGIPGGTWSMRATGLLSLPSAGSYALQANVDDRIRVWIDDVLALDAWGVHGTYTGSFAASSSRVRIRLEYANTGGPGSLNLQWKPPGASSFTTIPGSVLSPAYNLVTSTTTSDSAPDAVPAGMPAVSSSQVPTMVTATEYAQPWLGLATATVVDPGGEDLRTTTEYEAPGTNSYLRRTGRWLPAAASTVGAGQYPDAGLGTTYTYYGKTETLAQVTCGVGTDVVQGGQLRSATEPTPASGTAVQTSYVYDSWGASPAPSGQETPTGRARRTTPGDGRRHRPTLRRATSLLGQ